MGYITPTPLALCMYVEFLARSFKSAEAIRNYVSGVDLLHKLLGFHPPSSNYDVQLMLKAVSHTIGDSSRVKAPVSLDMLLDICVQCDALGTLGAVCKCVFLFGFFRFLRVSNLLAAWGTTFSMRRMLCQGDVLVHPPGLVLLIRWSKT